MILSKTIHAWRLSAAAVLLAAAMLLQAGPAENGKSLVDGFLHEMTSLQGDFQQSVLGADGEVLEQTRGTLTIQRPGRFRWEYREPYEQLMIADGLNIWFYDVDLAQITVKPQAEALDNTPALLLSGADEAMQQFDYEGSYVEHETTWVRLSPKNTDSGFLRVELGFVNDQISRMVFFDSLEQTTLVALDNVIVNETVDESRFNLDAPDYVDIVGAPAVAEAAMP